mmetsp:Transcript_27326/g.109431  ORF Transcript_27326/g.109431 Transcript_27326/m.109431 type:complete len:336 (+) Transcript_27326:169-1176(+)
MAVQETTTNYNIEPQPTTTNLSFREHNNSRHHQLTTTTHSGLLHLKGLLLGCNRDTLEGGDLGLVAAAADRADDVGIDEEDRDEVKERRDEGHVDTEVLAVRALELDLVGRLVGSAGEVVRGREPREPARTDRRELAREQEAVEHAPRRDVREDGAHDDERVRLDDRQDVVRDGRDDAVPEVDDEDLPVDPPEARSDADEEAVHEEHEDGALEDGDDARLDEGVALAGEEEVVILEVLRALVAVVDDRAEVDVLDDEDLEERVDRREAQDALALALVVLDGNAGEDAEDKDREERQDELRLDEVPLDDVHVEPARRLVRLERLAVLARDRAFSLA